MDVNVLDLQRMSTEDGPGLRTTVFFKGCNLKCAWCHNPESISYRPDPNWFKNKCIGCNICVAVCPQKGISKTSDGLHFSRERCTACRTCEKKCPNAAIELKGKRYETDALARELLKDKAYWGADGGVTLSGGEVMMQHKAAIEVARLLKEERVSVAVDTAGCYDFRILEEILPYTDLVLYDLKLFDPKDHKKYTGADNAVILENYKKLTDKKIRVWVRTPIIEGATDTPQNIESIARFLAEIGQPERWELCTFNNLCRDKYERLDLTWAYQETQKTSKQHAENLQEIARRYVANAAYTGAVQEVISNR
ncbi:MAG: glycyl-radical enzyme activating protein [Clostridiales bacterium]|jgi:pyruvate formate lyase activating enzyme|nr:glycyl-radical enzyme activating protein [Clostridiales bacterium]